MAAENEVIEGQEDAALRGGDDDAFDAAFEAPELVKKRIVEAVNAPANVAAAAAIASPTSTEPVPAAPAQATPVTKPKYAKVTEEQLASLLATAVELKSIKADTKKHTDALYGRVGTLKQLLDQVQSNTAAGAPVELTEDVVSDITEMYPDLGGANLKAFKKLAQALRGTRPAAPSAPAPAPAPVASPAPAPDDIATIRNKLAAEELAEEFPNWRDITGAAGSTTEFRTWLEKEPGNYGSRVLNSSKASLIAEAIRKFEAFKNPAAATTAASKVPNRADRFSSAITPKGAGGHAPAPTEIDPFDVGFYGKR